MKRRLFNVLTRLLIAAGCGLFVWGLLYQKLHTAGWPGVARFGIVSVTPDSVYVGDVTLAPLWAIAIGLGVTPGLVADLKKKRRDRRRSEGLCPACGYDLRATPGQCPECGAAAAISVSR